MEAKRKDDEEEMSDIEGLEVNYRERMRFIDITSEANQYICPHCGLELNPRKFQFEDESTAWGIFDNCRPFKEHKVYPTLKEAIEAFKWQK